jgi:hypothetical protein
MSETDGHQAIGCDVSSCRHFKNSLCELSNIKVGACNNVTNGMAEDETLCSSYEKREDHVDNLANISSESMANISEFDGLL